MKLPFATTKPKFVQFGQKRATTIEAPAVVVSRPLEGKMVYYPSEGKTVPALVTKQDDSRIVVKLAVPDENGILRVTDTETQLPEVDGIEAIDCPYKEVKMRRFEQSVEGDVKSSHIKDEEGRIKDYKDVVIEGFASTFQETTAADRDGDYIVQGAFDKTLADFRRNPVMLLDHKNSVDSLAGSYSRITVNSKGLSIVGNVSNAPGLADVRFKVAEGHLKALSIGGMFYWGGDGKAIESVDLWEVSLIPVPANPDALVEARAITLDDCKSAMLRIK